MYESLGVLCGRASDVKHVVVDAENLDFLNHELDTDTLGLLDAVDLCYIDPPYNTRNGNYSYADSQKTADWVTFMRDRLVPLRKLLKPTGVVMISIDDSEVHTLRFLLDEVFGKRNFMAQLIIDGGNPKNNARFFSISHEYILVYANNLQALSASGVKWRTRRKGIDLLLKEYASLKRVHGDDYAAITTALKIWTKTAPISKRLKVFHNAEARGLYTYADLSAPGKGARYDVLHPVTGKPCQVPSRGWGLKQEKVEALIADNRILFGKDETFQPMKKLFLRDEKDQVQNGILSFPSRTTTHILEKLLGMRASFTHPKNLDLMKSIIDLVTPADGVVLDYFAGSGTTAHAVMDLNRAEASSSRTCVLVTNNENDIYDKVARPRVVKVWEHWNTMKTARSVDSVEFLRMT